MNERETLQAFVDEATQQLEEAGRQRAERVEASEQTAPASHSGAFDAEAAKCSPSMSKTEQLRADADHLLRLVHGQANDFHELLRIAGLINARLERLEEMIQKRGLGLSAVEHENKGDSTRVADLESQLESVACRAATAENRVEQLEAAAKIFFDDRLPPSTLGPPDPEANG